MKKINKAKFEKYIHLLAILGLLFLFILWDIARTQIKDYEQQEAYLIKSELQELHSVFYSIEETLTRYDFPIQDDMRAYYQDALDSDIQRVHHLGDTINNLNKFSNFHMLDESYFEKIEKILKGLRGFHYSEEEKSIAVEALDEVQTELFTLLDQREFSVENKKDREDVLEVLDGFIESISVIERY